MMEHTEKDLGTHVGARVMKCEPEKVGSDVFLLGLEIQKPEDFKPGLGQFVSLRPPDKHFPMPRPFTIVNYEDNILTLLIKVVGHNTRAYSKLKYGQNVELYPPQGKVLELDPLVENYMLVGGGTGNFALISIAKRIKEMGKNLIVILGAKKEKLIPALNFFDRDSYLVLTIGEEGGGNGQKGYTTDLLEESLSDASTDIQVIACGPRAMLRKTAEICASIQSYKCKCQIIVEEVMACSMGACKGCAIFGVDGSHKHVCSDGPAFDADWVDMKKFAPEAPKCLPRLKDISDEGMHVKLGSLLLEYPSMNSSGCLSIEALRMGKFNRSCLGALVTKAVTVDPRMGNPMPRTCETESGMLNSIGLENIGLQRFKREELPEWIGTGIPVIVNISGSSNEEYAVLAEELDPYDIEGMEVNISCPNVKEGNMAFGKDAALAYRVTALVRKKTEKFLIVKLTPNVTNIVDIARAVVNAGADAISLINTVQGMAIDPLTRKSRLWTDYGGLSGPAIMPIALCMVRQVYLAKLGVPIIGMGGITDGDSAAQFFMAGANVIAVGTNGFSNRNTFSEIDEVIKKLMCHHGFSHISQLTGSQIP